VALIRAYHGVAHKARDKLLEQRSVLAAMHSWLITGLDTLVVLVVGSEVPPGEKRTKQEKEALRKELESSTAWEATSYALFAVNLTFAVGLTRKKKTHRW